MKSTAEHTRYLWGQYIAQKATSAELDELYKIIGDASGDEDNMRFFHAELEKYPQDTVMEEDTRYAILQKILQTDKNKAVVTRSSFLQKSWFRYAAILLLISGTAAALYFKNQHSPEYMARVPEIGGPSMDVSPGGNRAILTLADGSVIVLDSAANGNLAKQGVTQVIKLNNGQLSYRKDASVTEIVPEVVYNTISTPRGGQYQIVLPDGSHVWLNAASSLRFPTVFNGSARHVELTGEAYFEIEENKAMPFTISSDKMKVQVLGTNFNINSYHDEPVIKTTLISGSIKLFHGNEEQIIKPGQQAHIVKGGNKINVISKANIEEALAWKNGYFLMKGADIPTIMRQVSRWYDVEIKYKGDIPEKTLGGRLPRNVNVSQILKIFELYNIHSSIEGKTITIDPGKDR